MDLSKTTHNVREFMSLGYVNTDQLKATGTLSPLLAKLFKLIEPSEMGKIITEHIEDNSPSEVNGKFYKRSKVLIVKREFKDEAIYLKLSEIVY